jgi:hypothetical protein
VYFSDTRGLGLVEPVQSAGLIRLTGWWPGWSDVHSDGILRLALGGLPGKAWTIRRPLRNGWLALPKPGASRRGCATRTHESTMLAIAAGYEKLARRAEVTKAEAPASTDIYRSSNGDRWRLISDSVSGRRLVRHEANPASGGQITETTVEEFLAVNGPGPEYEALRRMLSSSGEQAREVDR